MIRSNYDQAIAIKKYGLEWGVYLLCAMQGAGKTSSGVVFLRTDFKYHSERRIKEALMHYKARGMDLAQLPIVTPTPPGKKRDRAREALPNHLYYSNVDMALKGTLCTVEDEFKPHYITPNDILLPDGKNPFQYFPYGSVIFLQEASDYWHSYDWQKLTDSVRKFMKYIRHNNITLIFDTHAGSDIAKQLRDLITEKIEVEGLYYRPPRLFGIIQARTTWYYKWSLPQYIEAAQERGESAKDYIYNACFRLKGSVRDAYDSNSGEALFLRGIYDTGFVVRSHPKKDFSSAEAIENYCKNYDIPHEKKKEEDKQTA